MLGRVRGRARKCPNATRVCGAGSRMLTGVSEVSCVVVDKGHRMREERGPKAKKIVCLGSFDSFGVSSGLARGSYLPLVNLGWSVHPTG
jgi:hypothetical protein